MEITYTAVPDMLLQELDKTQFRLQYTSPQFLYHCVWLWGDTYCGVFGDGPNGSYEWFIWDKTHATMKTSNKGYGSTSVALRDVLMEMEPVRGLSYPSGGVRATEKGESQ